MGVVWFGGGGAYEVLPWGAKILVKPLFQPSSSNITGGNKYFWRIKEEVWVIRIYLFPTGRK